MKTQQVQTENNNVVKLPVNKGKMTNLEELFQIVDIQKVLEDFTGEHYVTSSDTYSMPCPIKKHNHSNDGKQQLVVWVDGRNICKCMSRDESFNVWTVAEKLYEIEFRRAVHKVAEICGVLNQIEYKSREPMTETERQEKAEESIARVMGRASFPEKDKSTLDDVSLALFDMFGLWADESKRKDEVVNDFLYDPVHDSLAILEKGTDNKVVNIRHHERFTYDKKAGTYLDSRQTGKWFSLPSCTSHRAYSSIETEDGPIFIVEGAKDRLAAELLSLDHIALTSVGSLNSFTREELLPVLGRRKVIIYPDNDQAAQKMAATADEKLDGIAESVRVIPWTEMVDNPKKGYDLADFTKSQDWDIEELRQALIEPDTWIRKRMMQHYKIQKADVSGDMRTFEERKQDFTNCGFMPIRKNTVSLLVAPGGTGKTFFMLYFLLRFILDERKPAIMFASEENYFELMDRLRRIIQVTIGLEGDERQEAERLVNEYLCVAPCESNFGSIQREGTFGYEIDESKVNVIEQLVKPFELVVLDPLITFFGGPENDNGAARTFMNVFLKLANDHNKTVLIVHHSTKDKTSSRGASAFVDAARAVYELREVSEMDYKKMKEEARGKVEFAPVGHYRDLVVTKDNYNCKAYLSNKGEHLVATLPNGLRFKLF